MDLRGGLSRTIDLAKMEHATPEYQSINPNGLVPTLIHDGRTYIESIDIIQYLTPPSNKSLRRSNRAARNPSIRVVRAVPSSAALATTPILKLLKPISDK